MGKKELREQIRQKKRVMTQLQIEKESQQIAKKFLAAAEYKNAKVIYCYVSYNQEVDTSFIIEQALLEGKQVAVPKVVGEEIKFYTIKQYSDLQKGYQGILEPIPFECVDGQSGLMIMPGLAFDKKLHRLGYGGGFYDKYLEKYRDVFLYKIALAYDFQILHKIETKEYDKKVDEILTPSRVIRSLYEKNETAKRKGVSMSTLEQLGQQAKKAATILNRLGQIEKNNGLQAVAEALLTQEKYIMDANEMDVTLAEKNGVKASLVDRLRLTHDRLSGMAEGLVQIIGLKDPIGEVLSMETRPNGLQIGQKRVPLGVIGIIYESRPNVTADAFGLCFKTGNAVILRGGSDAIHSNKAIVKVIQEALKSVGLPENAIQLVEDTSREVAKEMMRLNQYIDVLIPRGGAGLIKTIVENSTIPVIETGTGNCHVYVDEFADLDMAVQIIYNAKTQRLGVCNACESLVLHRAVAEQVLPLICHKLKEKEIEIRGDETAQKIMSSILPATEADWGTEYLDAIISVKVVDTIEEAIEHINTYNTKHSEAIITNDYNHSLQFLNEIDAAAVYVNASTRFTDGFEFGFGAEIGISTQKLHARGPMGLLALTTTKYIILGNGQVRP